MFGKGPVPGQIRTECILEKGRVSGLLFQVCMFGKNPVSGLLLTECIFVKDSVSGLLFQVCMVWEESRLWTAPYRRYIREGQRLRSALSSMYIWEGNGFWTAPY